jgi:hypothetical protein
MIARYEARPATGYAQESGERVVVAEGVRTGRENMWESKEIISLSCLGGRK